MVRVSWILFFGALIASLSALCAESKSLSSLCADGKWTWSANDGGIGEFRKSNEQTHDGESSLFLSHTNALGCTRLNSDFISVKPGKTYMVSAWLRPTKNIRRGVYLEVSQYLADDDTPQIWDSWGNRPQTFSGGEWQQISIPIMVRNGNARLRIHCIQSLSESEVYWDDFIVSEFRPPKYDPPANEPLPDMAQAKEIVAKRPRADVRIEQRDGQPRLFLDGVPTPWTFYVSPFSSSEKAQIADFRNAGIRVYLVPLALGRGISDGIGQGPWRGQGNWNFSKLDALLWRVLRVDPNAYIIFYMACDPYIGWGAENPEHVTQDQDGSKIIVKGARPKRWGNDPKAPEYFGPSLVSMKLRADISATLRELTKYVEQSEAGKAVIGYHVAGFCDGQWVQWTQNYIGGCLSKNFGDYSPGAQNSFREWLRQRYNENLAALRKAWNRPDLTFDTAAVPKKERYLSIVGNIMSPETHQDVIDYNRFHSEGVADTITTLAKAIKDSTPRRILCGTYYEDITSPLSCHTALGRLLADGSLDYMSGPAAYDIRLPGFQGAVRSVFGSTLLHGKTYLTEQDWRSPHTASAGPGNDFSWGRAETPEEHNAMVRRECGMMLAFGLGTWWYDMTGGWLHDDKIMAGIAEARRAFGLDLQNHGAPRADLAVFVSEESADCVNPESFDLFRAVILEQIHELNTAGVPYRLYLQSDLGRIKIPQHRLYLFLNPYRISNTEKRAIDELKRDGNTLVFLHSPGIVGVTDADKAITDLTGICVRRIYRGVSGGLNLIPGSALNPLVRGQDGMLTLPRNCYSYPRPSEPWIDNPAYEVIDGKAVPLACYAYNNNSIGAAVRAFDEWKSVFIGGTGLSAPFIAKLAREAGCWCVSEPGDAVYASQYFLTIHAMFPGRKTLTLARPSRIVDIITNQVIAEQTTTFQLDMERGVTRWFALTPVDVK